MSFEGYYQILCVNGHLDGEDVYSFDEKTWRCRHCRASAQWINKVNTTNGSWDFDAETGEQIRIDNHVELEKCRPAEFCDKCHQEIAPCTYYIPTDQGHSVSISETEIDGEFEDNEFEGEDC